MKKNEHTKQHLNPWMRRFFLLIIGCFLGVNLYLVNSTSLLGNTMPMPLGFGMATVLSGSMEPTFSKGDLIIVKEKETYEPGDIVVYQTGNERIVHRLITITGNTVYTKGDANDLADPGFEKSAIKGAVIGCIPGVGTVVGWFKTPVGTILMLVLAFLLIEGSFRKQKTMDDVKLEDIKSEIRRLKEEREE